MKRIAKKLWIVLWCVILVVCIVFALITRQSFSDYRNDLDAVMNAQYGYHVPLGDWWEASYDDLYDQSDFIVRGTFTGSRKLVNRALSNEITVEQVYKNSSGKDLPATISVLEEIELFKSEDGVLRSMEPSAFYCAYGAMKEGSEYLMFLRYKGSSEYTRRDKVDLEDGSYEYAFVQIPIYSRICLSEEGKSSPSIISEPEDVVTLKESADYDVFAGDEEQVELYRENVKMIKDRVFGE